jgi:hypothetical protein
MTRLAVLVCSVLVLAAGATASTPSATDTKAYLRLTSTYPLTVRGTAFKPRERVTLSVQVLSTNQRRVRKLTTGPLGGFTTRFPTLMGVDRCEVVATAVGNRGSRAELKTPQAQCRPRQSPGSAALRVADTTPVTVVGTRFRAHEEVVVRATVDRNESLRRVSATPAGQFTVTFSGVFVDRCNSDLFVTAIGARGSEASTKIGAQPQCAPRG